MQQLPSEHTVNVNAFDYQYPIKRMFISRFKNGYLANIDYANLEMRVIGLLSQDKGMYDAFISGKDIHRSTASLAFKIPYDEVDKDNRQAAKAVNFGLSYGLGDKNLAKRINSTEEYAGKVRQAVVDSRPRMKTLMKETQEFAESHGYVTTMVGFRRFLKEAQYGNKYDKLSGLRKSFNTLIQGTGAALTNTAVYMSVALFNKYHLKSKVILTVHDSIVVDVHPDEVYVAPLLVKKVMENLTYPWLFVIIDGKKVRYPIEADAEIGRDYGDTVAYNPEEMKKFRNIDDYIDYRLGLSYISDASSEESGVLSPEQADGKREALAKKYLVDRGN